MPGAASDAGTSDVPASQDGLASDAYDEGVTVDLLTTTYRAHYGTLLRLAALLLDDPHSCEDVVQEAFVRVHVARHRLREPDKTLAYLRQTVVNLSRSTLRRRLMALRLMPRPPADEPAAEEGAHGVLERDALVRVLRELPRRQREVIVLRYYADLTEVQVADLLGLSVGSVKAYGSRGLEALRARMETS
ncbi:MAG: SigE family RNA polymerase sigma factor [Streptomycetaceae bacterium]|nr:SigE family RNA polymerase sigma factor [Streptomycetaceae bacterium]